MPTNYPTALDDSTTQPTAADLANDNLDTKPHSTVHGNHGEAIIAIETELGTDPSGASATVKARFDALDTTVAAKYAPGGTDVAVADGGTGASTAAGARTNLGVAIGSDVQAYDGDLATLSTAFGSASASGPATLAFHEDTDNGTNKITVSGVASVAADRTLTLPDADDTLVGKATTDTLTNKTIDLTSNTLVGSVAEFNTALEAADFYTSGGTDVAVADGGTGASTAAGARTNLDVPSNAEAVLDTLVDAKGDLFTATAADTPARLAVGADGLFLKANSAQATGLEWATGGGGASTLDDLTDVTITTPATGATLIYNGSAWIDGQLDLADTDAVTGTLPITRGGTGGATATAARAALGTSRIVDSDTGQTQTNSNTNLTNASLINTNGLQIPAGATVGDVYRVRIWGTVNHSAVWSTTPTFSFTVKIGATSLTQAAGTTWSAVAGGGFQAEFNIAITATDVQRTFGGRFYNTSTAGVATTSQAAIYGVTAEDDAAAISIDYLITTTGSGGTCSGTWIVNYATLELMSV